MAGLYLEDFVVGARFTSGAHTLDADQIRAFARQFDPQPFHLDEETAKDTFFGGLAASGWHTAAITMSLLVQSAPVAGGLIGAGADIAWPRPTRPGDELHLEGEVLAVTPSRSKPDRGVVTIRCETRNQRGEVVQTMTCPLLVWRKPA
ncbi:MAG: MaoC family dehydratase [Alphaproteobacteria bacterium]|nr:MaoC family dehydratase [Alphaproteobacteria bacterium]